MRVCVLPKPVAGLYLMVGVLALPLFVVQVTWKDRANKNRDGAKENILGEKKFEVRLDLTFSWQ